MIKETVVADAPDSVDVEDLNAELEALRQLTQKVSPGPWHRVSSAVMKRTQLRSNLAPRLAEGGYDENRRTSGWIGMAEREEDADHFARVDREMFLWVIDDFQRRLDAHQKPAESHYYCQECARLWPCAEVLAVRQFIVHTYME